MGESGAQPGVPAEDGQAGGAGAPAPDAPADETVDDAVDASLRELFAASRAEDPGGPPVVFMSWYRGVSGLL